MSKGSSVFIKKECTECHQTFKVKLTGNRSKTTDSVKCSYHAKTGYWNPMQNPDFKEEFFKRRKDTWTREYGSYEEGYRQVCAKARNTYEKKTGYANPGLDPVVRQKSKKTLTEHYGVDSPMKSDEIRQKHIQTCLNHYGVENPSSVSEVKGKKRQTVANKWGDGDLKTAYKNIGDKSRISYLEKYGYENAGPDPAVKSKVKKTVKDKYGVDNVFQSDVVKKKIVDTNLRKYGVVYNSQRESVKTAIKSKMMAGYGVPYRILAEDVKRSNGAISKTNKKWQRLLKDKLGLDFDFEVKIGDDANSHADLGYENRLLLEINPSISHFSDIGYNCIKGFCKSTNGDHSKCGKDYDYHYRRAMAAYDNGQILLNIWDWTSENWILNKIALITGLIDESYDCDNLNNLNVKKIDLYLASTFLEEYADLISIDGILKTDDEIYGCYHNEELIYVQIYRSVEDPNEYELVRSDIKFGLNVDGIDQFVFDRFINDHENVNRVEIPVDFSDYENDVKIESLNSVSFTGPMAVWHKMRGRELPLVDDGTLEFEILLSSDYHKIMLPGFIVKEWTR